MYRRHNPLNYLCVYVDFFVWVWDSVLSPMRLTLFNNLALSFLCVSIRLALNNPMRRLVAHSDMMAITSGNRMSLTGCKGLGIVGALVEQTNLFFKNLVACFDCLNRG